MGGKKDKKGGKDKKTQDQMEEDQSPDTQTKAESEATTQDNTVIEDSTKAHHDQGTHSGTTTVHDPVLTKAEEAAPHNHFGADLKSYQEPTHTEHHPEPSKEVKHEEKPVEKPIEKPVEHPAPVEKTEVKHEPKPEEKKQKEEPQPPKVETHPEPPKKDVKPEEKPVPAKTETKDHHPVPDHSSDHHSDTKVSDHTSSFVKIGDSLPPQSDITDSQVKNIITDTPPAQTPKDISGQAPKEAQVPESTPVVVTSAPKQATVDLTEPKYKTGECDTKLHDNVQIGGSAQDSHKESAQPAKVEQKEKQDHLPVPEKRADITHSPILHPPIPDPPIPQPPVSIPLGNDHVPAEHETKKAGQPKDHGDQKKDGGSAQYWVYGFAAVAVAAVAFMKWKKVF
jgi:hypothetical protein